MLGYIFNKKPRKLGSTTQAMSKDDAPLLTSSNAKQYGIVPRDKLIEDNEFKARNSSFVDQQTSGDYLGLHIETNRDTDFSNNGKPYLRTESKFHESKPINKSGTMDEF